MDIFGEQLLLRGGINFFFNFPQTYFMIKPFKKKTVIFLCLPLLYQIRQVLPNITIKSKQMFVPHFLFVFVDIHAC